MTPLVSLRPATEEGDLAFLSELARDPAVEPFLAPGRGEPEALRELSSRLTEPPAGLYLIEWPPGRAVGGMALTPGNRRSRICELSRVMLDPGARGRGIAVAAVRLAAKAVLVEHDMHRIQAEVYGDNIAGQRLFERAGFTREGTRRRAYWRRERWLDGVLYGLLAEELDGAGPSGVSTGSPS